MAWSAPSHYLNQYWNIVDWTLGTNFSQTLIRIQTFSSKKIYLKMLSAKWRPFCLSLNALKNEFNMEWKSSSKAFVATQTEIILPMCPANERRHYIGWAHAQINHCMNSFQIKSHMTVPSVWWQPVKRLQIMVKVKVKRGTRPSMIAWNKKRTKFMKNQEAKFIQFECTWNLTHCGPLMA